LIVPLFFGLNHVIIKPCLYSPVFW